MKIGLVLEGGALRGMYTAGVLDVLMEEGIQADGVVGVSAGALFGVNYLSGQKGRALRYNKRFNSKRSYMGLLPLLLEGNIISTRYAYEKVPHRLDPFDNDAFLASPIPFYAVVTSVATGEPEYVRITDVFRQMDVLRASGSMPVVSTPVVLEGKPYLDGGISDSIPFRWMAEQGYEKLVVITTRDSTYRKKPAPSILRLYGRRYPQIAARMLDRHLRYNADLEELRRWEADGRAFVLRPSSPIVIDTLERNPEKMQAVYDIGTRDIRAALGRLQAYLQDA